VLYPLSNTPRDYAWGSTSLLPALQGREPSGAPEAEMWFGDHHGDPSDLPGGGTLAEVTGGTLPFLLKLLAADAPLSIQVHPSRAQAQAGFAREATLAIGDPARNYADDNHKPELLVALSDSFDALIGLRSAEASAGLVASLGQSAGVRALAASLHASEAGPAAAVRWALREASEAEIADVIQAALTTDVSGFEESLRMVRRAAGAYPADRGLVVALLMNAVRLRAGEAVFVGAGVLHAYQAGLGVEIMAASDNVLRGGLTPKRIDVDELLAILSPATGPVTVQRPEADAAVVHFQAPVSDFSLRRARLGAEPLEVALQPPAIILATAGAVTVTAGTEQFTLAPGDAVFAADEPAAQLRGLGEVFIAQAG